MDAVAHHRSGRVSSILFARNEAAAFRRGHQRLVCRSNGQDQLLQIRSDQLSRPASFLRALAFADIVRPQSLGAAIAGRARQHQLRLANFKIRTVRRPNRQPTRCLGDGALARFCFLRALLHSRSLACAFHDAVFLRAVRTLEIRDRKLSLVRRHGRDRNDSVEGDLHSSHRLRRDRGRCLLRIKLFQQARRPSSGNANLELCRSCRRDRDRHRADRVLLFGNVLSLERNQRSLPGVFAVVPNRERRPRAREAMVLLARAHQSL